jgi:hypothetical protein
VFPLLSTARLLIVTDPGVVDAQLKLHVVVPVAALKVAPPSTETSTRATDPPVSFAVPVMLTVVPVIINTVVMLQKQAPFINDGRLSRS